jgi:hypothetical protein
VKNRFAAIFSIATGIMLFSAGVAAHHGASVVYDLNQTVDMTGAVTDFQFVNPHVLIFFEVTERDGTMVVWSAGLTSPNRLARSDRWTKNTLRPGDWVTVTGAPARGGAPSLWVAQVVANGKPLLGRE